MQKKCGTEMTRQIKKRFDELKAARTFSDYLSLGLGNPHSLTGEFAGCYGISVTGNIRIIVEPICDDLMPESLKACEEVIMKGVADYHGQKVEWFIP